MPNSWRNLEKITFLLIFDKFPGTTIILISKYGMTQGKVKKMHEDGIF